MPAGKQLVLKGNVQPYPHPHGSASGARPGPPLISGQVDGSPRDSAGLTLKRPLTPLVLDSPALGVGGVGSRVGFLEGRPGKV